MSRERPAASTWLARGTMAALVLLVVVGILGAAATAPVAAWNGDGDGPANLGAAPNATGFDDVETEEFAEPGGDIASEPAVTEDGVIVAAGDRVLAYEQNGSEQWATTLSGGVTGTPAVTDARAFVVADDELTAIDTETGTVTWTATLDDVASGSVTVADGSVYAATANGTLYAYSTVGEQRWTYHANASLAATTPAVANGSAYVGAADGELHAVATANGSAQWTAAPADGDARLTTPVVADGSVLVAGANGTVASYATDGIQQWRVGGAGQVVGAPAVADGQVVVAATDGAVTALSTADGASQWTATVEAAETVGPQVSIAGGTVLVGTDAGTVHGLAAADGSQQWAEDIDGQLASAIAIHDGVGYLGTNDGVVHTLTPEADDEDDDGGGGGAPGGGDDDDGEFAPEPGEPAFTLTSVELGQDDRQVDVGELVTVDVGVANEGDGEGEFTANLTADGEVVDTTTVGVGDGANQTFLLAATFTEPGTYELAVDGELAGTVTVSGSPALAIEDVSVDSETVEAGESVIVTAVLANDGTSEGSRSVALTVEGEPVASEDVTVAAGETATVTFEHTLEEPGSYAFAVAGEPAGTVEVSDGSQDDSGEDSETEDGDEESGSSGGDGMPGFGAGAALLGLLSVALLAARRSGT